MNDELTFSDIENTLYHLNYRWKLQTLAMWNGQKTPFKAYEIYDSFNTFITLKTLSRIDSLNGNVNRHRLKHTLMDHYLQRALLPHEMEMRTWMRGAAAHVRGEKIYLHDVIPWCQKRSTYETRQDLQKETGPLAKFLKPFALNYWDVILRTLEDELGFKSYIEYVTDKKEIDYPYYYTTLKETLAQTDDLYFAAMEEWVQKRFGRRLPELTRFDAIHLLSLAHLDRFLPQTPLDELIPFFNIWGINLENTPGLNLILGKEDQKSHQAICFVLEIPDEVYVVMKPEGGWIDVETLWHELGHGLSAVFTSPEIPLVDREMATSFSLSESFAFLNQNITLSVPFLMEFLNIDRSVAERIHYYKVLKDMSLFRRYAAKFLTEYEVFSSGNLDDGGIYAENMRRYTGFYYQPESHLLDLVPELYSLDYLLGWITETLLAYHLKKTAGDEWMLGREGFGVLKDWWSQGNRHDIPGFLKQNNLEPLHMERLKRHWQNTLGG